MSEHFLKNFLTATTPGRLALALVLAAGLGACSTSPMKQGEALWSESHFEDAVMVLGEASHKDPSDRPLLALYHRRRDQALSQLSVAAESALSAHRLDEAQDLYQRALRLNPNWERALEGLDRIALARRLEIYFDEARRWAEEGRIAAAEGRLRQVLAANPGHQGARNLLQQILERQQDLNTIPPALKSALAKPVSVEFRETSLRNVFEVLSRAAGLNFVFDHDVRTDGKITIFIRNNPVEDVLRIILGTNALDRKILNENTLLIYPNTAAKAKEYQELAVRTFYLVNVEAKLAETMLKTMAHIRTCSSTKRSTWWSSATRRTPFALRNA